MKVTVSTNDSDYGEYADVTVTDEKGDVVSFTIARESRWRDGKHVSFHQVDVHAKRTVAVTLNGDVDQSLLPLAPT